MSATSQSEHGRPAHGAHVPVADEDAQRDERRRHNHRLHDPALYINRELSWLDFNERVLQLAEDESTPLIERVKFCAIYTTNLDE
ncbi:MAG TPA: hypothetical protein VGY30_13145, partial [Solirubrobacteraceae bacterium]|nr:hypothetical protein [Solirubrobacteraceae bacterium]